MTSSSRDRTNNLPEINIAMSQRTHIATASSVPMTEQNEFNHRYHTFLANSQNINSRAAVLMYNQSSIDVN